MLNLIHKANDQLIRHRVEDVTSLKAEVYASLVAYLDEIGAFRTAPFDADVCHGASLADLSRQRIEWFLERAGAEHGFPLKPTTSTEAVLVHLNLLHGSTPTNAAILLFGTNPQRFHRTAETKCVHYHGTEVRKPLTSQQIYPGDLFT
jgi:predicted HTH transcriptional regulator